MISYIKASLKLLLRNKGFLFFLLVTPAVSAFILSLKTEHYLNGEREKETVTELSGPREKAVYAGNTAACIIKVYDGAQSELSEALLEELAEIGMFSVCRCDVRGLTEEEVREAAERDAFEDRTGMLLYLKENFDTAALEGKWEEGLQLYAVSADERQELFKQELADFLGRVRQLREPCGGDVSAIRESLAAVREGLPQKRIVNLAGKEEIVLTRQQENQMAQIGYAFAIITLGFLFCGVCVAHSVIEEQNNKVYTRIMLTNLSVRAYFLSKFVTVFLISVLQTAVLGVCLSLIPGLDVGMSMVKFLMVIFLLGLIFGMLSLLLGVALGDVMSANYAVFTVWSISALLAGLYFPLDDTSKGLKALSYLMPQRWFMDASKLLLTGDKSVYSMLLCITAAYLIVIVSVGGVGLKLKRYE